MGSWPAALCSLRGAEKAVRLAASQASPASWVKDPSGAPDLAAAREAGSLVGRPPGSAAEMVGRSGRFVLRV